jgi:hypothetical protein
MTGLLEIEDMEKMPMGSRERNEEFKERPRTSFRASTTRTTRRTRKLGDK